MLSVGIDVAKGESMVCVMDRSFKIVMKPRKYKHVISVLGPLADRLRALGDPDIKIIMEATGIYSQPIAKFFHDQGFFVSVVNPYSMKMFRKGGRGDLRNVKTDKADSLAIAEYGIKLVEKLREYEPATGVYQQMNYLLRWYQETMKQRIALLQELNGITERTLPGIKAAGIVHGKASDSKDMLLDFVSTFWHYDQITAMSENAFKKRYLKFASKKGHRLSLEKATTIYRLAKDGIPSLPADHLVKQSIMRIVEELERVGATLRDILSQMTELAKSRPEYAVVRAMGGVGDVLAVKLIAVLGDVRRFKTSKALVAYAGIDPPPNSSGQFEGDKRRITKRGSTLARKIGYEVMKTLKSHKRPEDGAVYDYILRKESEGKAKKQAKIAGLNKFLRIYYARIKEAYGAPDSQA